MITLSIAVSLGVWVFVDSITRKANFLPWAIGTAILPPFVLPFYLAKRPLRAGEVREGGLAYNVLKNFVIVWTILMAAVTLLSVAAITGNTTGLRNEFEAAITAIGATLWLALLAAIWVFPFLGAVGIAFLLKKSSIVEKGPTGPLALHAEQKGLALPGWSAWAAVAILWGIAILAILGVTAFRAYYTEKQLHAEEAESPLVQAASRGDSKAVSALVKEGADINEALALAVKHRHFEAIRVLLANGADLNSSGYEELPRAAQARVNLAALLQAGMQAEGRVISVSATGNNYETLEFSSDLIFDGSNTFRAVEAETTLCADCVIQYKHLGFKQIVIRGPVGKYRQVIRLR